jgi:O-antigen/teichoic acid export membrane protein
MRVSTFLLIPPTLILVGASESILDLLYGPGSVAAAPIVRILAPAVFLAGLSSVVGYGIAGTGRMWEGLVLNLLWAVVLVTSAFFLIPRAAAIGLAIAYVVAYSIHFVTVMAYAGRRWRVNFRDFRAPAVIAASSLSALMLLDLLFDNHWKLFLEIGVVVAVMLAEYATMSRREIEVLGEPLRKLIRWINPSP